MSATIVGYSPPKPYPRKTESWKATSLAIYALVVSKVGQDGFDVAAQRGGGGGGANRLYWLVGFVAWFLKPHCWTYFC